MAHEQATIRQQFFQYQAQTSPFPSALEMERAEGCLIYKTDGTACIDMIAGIAVSALGHGHPAVRQAIIEQADKHLHLTAYGEFIQAPQVRLARKISELLGHGEWSTYFVNSGSEAAEGAMKLAKRFTGRAGFVAFEKAYHGTTQGAMSLMGGDYYKGRYQPLLPGVTHIPYNDVKALEAITQDTAAVFYESIQGEAGVIHGEPQFMRALRKRCDETGALLVVDEIQTGFGRTGKWFGFHHFDIVPDIVLMAKGMGGGLPIGAFSARSEVMKTLSFEPMLGHVTTYGGNPLCCNVSLAVIRTLEEEQIIRQVDEKSSWFKSAFEGHPDVASFRAAGLLMALTPASGIEVMKVNEYCMQRGVITDWFLFNAESIRLAPPLVITKEIADRAIATLKESLAAVKSGG